MNKITKKNKKKYTSLFKMSEFYRRVVYRNHNINTIFKMRHKYYEVLDFKNSTLFSTLISVPVITKAKCKKSRINKVYSYRIISIEEFNELSGLNWVIRDIRPQ